MNYKDTFLKILVECCRLLIGVVFIFSGLVKAIDPVGFGIKIGEYFIAFGLDKLQSFSTILSFNLSAIEFMLGICILLGVYRRYASLLTLIFMSFMTPLTLYLALFDPVSDCGCFGDALVLTNWETFFKNIVLLAAAIILLIHNQRIFPFYTYKVYWFVALYSFLACSWFSYLNYRHLPIIDFRPYKIGANIPELMTIPEGAPEDEYEYSFIYEKEGQKKTFLLDEIPSEESGWTFVESKTELIKKGYTPAVTSFILYDESGQDVSEKLLNSPTDLFLLIAPSLEKANNEQIDEINHIYDYAIENKLLFYGVTGSSYDTINRWKDYTGAEYPFLEADDVLLKTIIRSNPGLVLLKEGTIRGKWHYRDLPKEEQIGEFMSYFSQNDSYLKKEERSLMNNILTFALPLLLVWGYDYLRNRRRKIQIIEYSHSAS